MRAVREVGTTNRTRMADYAAALSDRTGMILRVHPSNFRIDGFTERPALADLVALGRRFGVPVVEDQGSGYAGVPAGHPALQQEPDVRASVAAGADVVIFSGDKLLGGPQSGLIVGAEAAVGPLRRHPLMRVLRVDKLTIAALEATLAEHVAGRAATTIPVLAMLTLTLEALTLRAERIAERLRLAGLPASTAHGHSTIGGGSAPGSSVPTRLIVVADTDLTRLDAALRSGSVPVVARLEEGTMVFDPRTVPAAQDDLLITLVTEAWRRIP